MEVIIRKVAVTVLIVTVILLTFVSILAIWDVLDPAALYKSLTTMFVVGFGSLIVVASSKFYEEHTGRKK